MEVEQTAEDATKPDDAVERMDIDEETKEPIAKRIQLEMPREEKIKMHMSMYADKVEARKDGPGVFGRLGEDNEIKIEVTAHFEKNKKRNSGVNRRLDTDELSSESDDDEDDAIVKTSEGKLHRDNVLPREEPNETAEIEITVQDENDILYVNEDFKVEETEKNDDLRNQLDSKDLRGLLKKKTTSDSDEDNKKGAVDLREKLRQRQNKKSFDPSKVNLCIEVTEVSEEEEEEEEEEF